jgi:hypothetical protein
MDQAMLKIKLWNPTGMCQWKRQRELQAVYMGQEFKDELGCWSTWGHHNNNNTTNQQHNQQQHHNQQTTRREVTQNRDL